MPDDKKKKAEELAIEQRRRSDRILDRTATEPVRRQYDRANADLVQRLSRMFRGRLREDADPAVMRLILRELDQAMMELGMRVGDIFAANAASSSAEAIRGLQAFLGAMVGTTPLHDEALALAILDRVQAELEIQRREAAEAMAAHVAERARTKLLASIPLLAVATRQGLTVQAEALAAARAEARIRVGERRARAEEAAAERVRDRGVTIGDVISDVGETLDDQGWIPEQTTRTVGSEDQNATTGEAVRTIAGEPEFRAMKVRWTELVSDSDGSPLDNRVGVDSLVLHAQIVEPGGVFTMPHDPRLEKSLAKMIGMQWTNPPNRPNDRAVLTPWLAEWGQPGWQYDAGTRRFVIPFGGGGGDFTP